MAHDSYDLSLTEPTNLSITHIHTRALLSVTEMRGDGDGASLPNADSDQALIHAGDHVASTHVCVIGTITRVAEEKKILGK